MTVTAPAAADSQRSRPKARNQLDSGADVAGERHDSLRPRLLRLVQVGATLAAFFYLARQVDVEELAIATHRTSWSTVLGGVALYYSALSCGALRWRWLLSALGARHLPTLGRLARLYLVGLFYNTFVPGGIGGDFIRALAVRDAFGPGGMTASLSVVLLERAMGLGGMCLLVAGTAWAFPLSGLPSAVSYLGALGVFLSVGGFLGLGMARRLAILAKGPLARLLARLPLLKDARPMPPAVLSAVATHFLAACGSHLFIVMVAPDTLLTQSLVVVPLALSAAYLPISVGGVGVVEVALVELLQLGGVPPADALVAALCIRLCQWLVALPGGLLALFDRGKLPPSSVSHGPAAGVGSD